MPATINSMGPFSARIASTGDETVLPVSSVTPSPNVLELIHRHSGNLAPTAVVVPGADPRIRVSMPFQAAYDFFGLGVAKLNLMTAYLARYADFERDPTANHGTLTLDPGGSAAAQITGWSVDVDGILMAQVEIVPLTNDDEPPLVFAVAKTIPALTGSPQLHTMGPVAWGNPNVVVPGLISSAGRIAGSLDVRRSDGDRFSRVAARYQIAPQLEMAHGDTRALLTALGVTGISLTGAATLTAYYKSYNISTGDVSTANSISITVAEGRIHPEDHSLLQGAVASSSFRVVGIAPDGTTNPFAIATNATAPTFS